MKKVCLVRMDLQIPGGSERVCVNLANEFSNEFEVHVVSILGGDSAPFFPLNNNVVYKTLFSEQKRIRDALIKGVVLLRKYLEENNIDVVLAIGASVYLFVSLATVKTQCVSVLCEHGNCVNKFADNLVHKICRKIGVLFADKVVTLTESDRKGYIERYHLKPQKVKYIYNWIDDELLKKNAAYNMKSKKIISVSRIEPLKGIDNILKVSKKIYAKHPDWQWDIYGEGEKDYVDQLSKQIVENDLQDFLFLKGKVKNIYDRYDKYSLFVLTSYTEGLPMVLLEAKAMKIPIISYNCLTGPSEIIRNGVDGFLIEIDNIEELFEKIDLCMSDQEIRSELSKHAYGNIEMFSKHKILDEWIDLINGF